LLLIGDNDFDLADALDTVTKRPAPATKKPPAGNNPRPNLYPDLRPQAGGHGNADNPRPNLYPDLRPYGNDEYRNFIYLGYLSDSDLNDGKPLPPAAEREHISDHGGNTVDSSTTAQITSPVVAVVVLLTVGVVVGYSAYKEKRYCFKPRGKNDDGKHYIFL
ncbi:glycoprotein Xg-like, partial [Varanus komodoensis]|uniref:glycoprotein Xg-like n=1 Tax=Varanus komodoensis TaxID=61221 RepID=UPI001CF76E93